MRWTEPWHSAYALVGMMVLGVAPRLIPLTVEQRGNDSATLVGDSWSRCALESRAIADRRGTLQLRMRHGQTPQRRPPPAPREGKRR
ncbi:hypothetical protein G7067_03735 [Leucobacter insecticola]|uniref:Uncharacterized protein n=1 Tax=Leucobacter insecticola TaxID=2714934 RepID=A0A6G8FGU1_9MICO|nr:hypothetical protein [Leucobacter insecticola]QIM15726.1 hypothetical protein G7067_03735 [Leucobacter insecticola]